MARIDLDNLLGNAILDLADQDGVANLNVLTQITRRPITTVLSESELLAQIGCANLAERHDDP